MRTLLPRDVPPRATLLVLVLVGLVTGRLVRNVREHGERLPDRLASIGPVARARCKCGARCVGYGVRMAAWERIALVTDVEWIIHATSVFGWMTPGELKHFPVSQRGDAISWARG